MHSKTDIQDLKVFVNTIIVPKSCNLGYTFFYYIKVSGKPSGNKLIKTIRYPHM